MRIILLLFALLPVFPVFAQAAENAAVKTGTEIQAAVPGPLPGMKVTEAYIRMAARDAYFWGWPMANMYNRRLAFKDLSQPALMGGIVPVAPLNRLAMLTGYIDPGERLVACPNQDVVYGAGSIALDIEPVVVQVPDFGKRFWVYQVVDLRTDSFAELGTMYGTKPGFYLLAGPDWKGSVPKGIARVFRASTNTGMFIPRVFMNDDPQDKKAVQQVIQGIALYPLSEFDGAMKTRDWSTLPSIEAAQQRSGQKGETQWVVPEHFFDELPALLQDAPPLPGEEARYQHMRFLANLAKNDPKLREVMIDEAKKADADLVAPLLQLRSFGLPLAHNWGTISNGAAFGTDYFTRTAVARSNILVNKEAETKYFYQDLDADGKRLNGGNAYTLTFGREGVPSKGFWSLTLYGDTHFFVPNGMNRYSIGTKSRGLQYNADGSLTLYVQAASPGKDKESNWLPSPDGDDFSLYIRAYWPTDEVLNGKWLPPAVVTQ